MNTFTSPKIVICVSTVLSWSATPAKLKGEEDEDEPDSEPEEEEQGNEEEKKIFVSFREKDFPLREALPLYEKYLTLESLTMATGSAAEHINTFVICSGLRYGRGEDLLFPHFMHAWLQKPMKLPIFGKGRNRLPTIHIDDLAEYVLAVIDKKPGQKYILALDTPERRSQKYIVEGISQGVGTGKTLSLPIDDSSDSEYNDYFNTKHLLSMDLRMRATNLVSSEEDEEEEAVEEEEGEQDVEQVKKPKKRKFQWKCKEGIVKNIYLLNQEFNESRGLRPMRLFVNGPPSSGKSDVITFIAKEYNIPLVSIKDLISTILQLVNSIIQEDELGEEARASFQESKEKLIEQAQEVLDKEKSTREKMGIELEVEPEVDESKLKPRIADQVLAKALKWRLMQNDCQNRGYVLDGFPKTYSQAKMLFYSLLIHLATKTIGEEEVLEVDQKLICHLGITLEASDEYLLQKMANFTEDEARGEHNNVNSLSRRLALYRSYLDSSDGKMLLEDFWKEEKIPFEKIQIEKFNVIEVSKSFLEKNGNIQSFLEQLNEEREKEVREKHLHDCNVQERLVVSQKEESNIKEDEARKLTEASYDYKKEELKFHANSLLEQLSKPLKEYFEEHVVDKLVDGLIDVLENLPEDPIDHLAQYLFSRSLEITQPLPL